MPSRPTLTCADCEKPMWSGRGCLPQGLARCNPCRRLGPPRASRPRITAWLCERCGKPSERPPTKGQRPKWCGHRCAQAAAIERAQALLAASRRDCEACGAEYAPSDRRQKFCSRSCAGVATARPTWTMSVKKRAERRAARAAEGSTGGNRVWVQGDCLVCGSGFLSPGAASRYCSTECRAVSRRRRSWISYPDRLELYRRDDYTCHICGESTSAEYDGTDPWSPTLDHLVPRALGGGDGPENLATAHLWCNSVRGDLTHFTDGDLAEV